MKKNQNHNTKNKLIEEKYIINLKSSKIVTKLY
jgi:hypothetical protein